MAVGSHVITASYVGDTCFNPSGGSLTQLALGVVGPFARLDKNGKGTGQFKAGSMIPVKFQITDGALLIKTATGNVTIGSATATFRWDESAQQYVANVKTASATGPFVVSVTLNAVGKKDIDTVELR